jgi:hypothetical protein
MDLDGHLGAWWLLPAAGGSEAGGVQTFATHMYMSVVLANRAQGTRPRRQRK